MTAVDTVLVRGRRALFTPVDQATLTYSGQAPRIKCPACLWSVSASDGRCANSKFGARARHCKKFTDPDSLTVLKGS